jgi:hypothetical protein
MFEGKRMMVVRILKSPIDDGATVNEDFNL